MNSFLKLSVCLSVVFGFLFFSFSNAKTHAEESPSISAEYAVSIDAKTGEVYFDKQANEKAHPASMTKVLTGIVLDEQLDETDPVFASDEAIATECSCYGLQTGEVLSKEDAMHALMLKSANDVAVAVATTVGGSVEGFAKLLNERAKQLGLKHTHFVSPNGLTDVNHYTTAYDMALIMKEAMKHPNVMKAMSAKNYTVDSNKKTVTLKRTDKIFTLDLADSVAGKIGFTNAAQYTLAVISKRGYKEIITVVMKTDKAPLYRDAKTIIDHTFDGMAVLTLVKKGELLQSMKVDGHSYDLIASHNVSIFKNNDGKNPTYSFVSFERQSEHKGITTFQIKDGFTFTVDVHMKGEDELRVPTSNHTGLIVSIGCGFLFLILFFFFFAKRR